MTKKTRAGTNRPARPAKKLTIDRQVLRDLPTTAEDGKDPRGGVSGAAGTVISGHGRSVNLGYSRSSVG